MSALWHPHKNENGMPVRIASPSTPTNPNWLGDASKIATFIPGAPALVALNGIDFASWTDVPTTRDGWSNVPGQRPIDEPAMQFGPIKRAAAGVVIEEADGRIWVVSPTNAFGGYQQTFPKGKVDKGLSLQAVAIKECFEESGLQVVITGLLGDFARSTSMARYYLARRVGGTPADAGWESQAVHLVPRACLNDFLNTADDRAIAAAIGECTNLNFA